jgi:hypothetical protein
LCDYRLELDVDARAWADGPIGDLLGARHFPVVARLVVLVRDEVEHLLDWSMDDDLAFYVTHDRCFALSHQLFRERANDLTDFHPHERRVVS